MMERKRMALLARIRRRLRNNIAELHRGEPGTRFQCYVKKRRQQRGDGFRPARIATFIVGLLLIGLGAAIGWLPGPGGFLAFIGFALIAVEVPPVAKLLDTIEVWLRRCWRRVFETANGRPPRPASDVNQRGEGSMTDSRRPR